jgi:hypothetical protein
MLLAIASLNQLVVFGVAADPYPHEVGTIFDGKCAVVEADPRRPLFAKPLELQRRMARVSFEKLEILAGQLLNVVRERVETLPELGRRPMHLEFSQLALTFRRFHFFMQEVEFARRGIALDLLVPVLPIPFGDPLPQPRELLARQGFNLGLNRFDLRHESFLGKIHCGLGQLYQSFCPAPTHVEAICASAGNGGDNLADVLSTGISRIAVGAAVTEAENPGVAARELLVMLEDLAVNAVVRE